LAAADHVSWHHGKTTARELWQELWPRLAAWGTSPAVELRSETGDHVWGVCGRSVTTPGGLILNLCNYRKEPETFRIIRGGQAVHTRDVLKSTTASASVALKPLESRLLCIAAP
jgi:hypothetical protein